MGKVQQKGMVLNLSVNSQLKNEQSVYYKTRIYNKTPKFTYLPRGREIIQRLIIRAALCNNIDELKTQREYDEERKKEEEKLKELEDERESERKKQEEILKEIYDLEKN